MQIYSTSDFIYDAPTKTFTQEISSFTRYGKEVVHHSFLLASEKTNKELEFELVKEVRDAEFDILCWNYELKKDVDKSLYKNLKVVIFND